MTTVADGPHPESNASSQVGHPASPKAELKASIGREHIKARAKAERLIMLLLGMLILDVVIGQGVADWREGTNIFWALGKSYAWTLGIIFVGGITGLFIVGIPVVAFVVYFGRYVGTLIGVALVLWLSAGSYHRGRDVLIAAVGAAAAVVLVILSLPRLRRWAAQLITSLERAVIRWSNPPDRERNSTNVAIAERLIVMLRTLETVHSVRYAGALWLLLTWSFASLADVTFGPTWLSAAAPAPIGSSRFEQLEQQRLAANTPTPTGATAKAPRRLGVALSGGGFRAAVMHAGVLAALEDLHVPIAGLATVSGGSIIGGYYVLGGAPADFRRAVADGRFNLKRDLADMQNLPFLPCPGHVGVVNVDLFWFCPDHSRIDVQANLLDRVLYDGRRVQDLKAQQQTGRAPFWLIGATDLLTGDSVGIAAQGILRRAQANPAMGPHRDRLLRTPSEPRFDDVSTEQSFNERRIAELVAFSGAFPGAFASTSMATKRSQLQIADGGITDNLGYSLLVSAQELQTRPSGTDWTVDRIIVSDGGMPLSQRTNVPGYLGAGDLMRAMDVVYASAGIGVGKTNAEAIWLFPGSIRLDQIREADFARVPKSLRDSRKLTQLQDLKNDLATATKTFLDTSTLKDNFTPGYYEAIARRFVDNPPRVASEAVDALYTLGEYLVYLNVCEIQKSVGTTSVPGC